MAVNSLGGSIPGEQLRRKSQRSNGSTRGEKIKYKVTFQLGIINAFCDWVKKLQ